MRDAPVWAWWVVGGSTAVYVLVTAQALRDLPLRRADPGLFFSLVVELAFELAIFLSFLATMWLATEFPYFATAFAVVFGTFAMVFLVTHRQVQVWVENRYSEAEGRTST